MRHVRVQVLLMYLLTVVESIQPPWRFIDYPSHGHDLLSYKNEVKFGSMTLTENKTWVSPTCIVTALSLVAYQLQCSHPGFHRIQLDDSVNNQVLLTVWAGEMADEEPSKDLHTTVLFQSLGQAPSVTILRPVEATVSELGYNSSSSCWEFHIMPNFAPVYEILLRISGRSISAMDCSIRPMLSVISLERFSGSAVEEFPFPNTSSIGFPVLFQDKQMLGTAVLLLSGLNLITQDGFETYSEFQLRHISDPIDEIDFTKAFLCALINGEVIIVSAGSPSILTASGLPSSGVEHITTAGTAPLPGIELTDVIVAWSLNIEDHTIYVSQDGGLRFHSIMVPFGSVQSMAVHPNNDEVVVLINVNNNMSQILTYDLSTGQWMTDRSTFAFATRGGNLTVKFFPGAFDDILLWEETAVYYSPNKGLTVDSVPVYTVIEGLLAPVSWGVDYTAIGQVSLGWNGRFAILSTEHQLFYGDILVGYALEIPNGVAPYSHPVVMFNSLGELLVISFNGSISEVYKVPTYSLLLSTLYPPPACPFSRWSHNIRRSLYYLDSSENLILWISVTPRQWQSNLLSYAISNQEIVDLLVREEVNPTAVEGVVERTMSVLLRPNLNTTDQYKLTALKLSLVNQNFACQSPAQTVALVSVQCPPTRHIRVRRPADNCPKYTDYTYKIPKNAYDPELKGRAHVDGDVDKFIHYNQSLWGCPIRMTYTEVFKPTLELYDGDELIREVDADYVVWELHGRTDFQYTSTASQAGCRSAAQVWTEMLQNGEHPSLAWTPQTYRHCFQDGGAVLDDYVPYQILNSSGVSSLAWYGHNAIFVFTATIVANHYSFCDLTATFAVEVYGATANSYIGYIFLVLTCAVGVAVLISSFFYYRYMIKSVKHKSD